MRFIKKCFAKELHRRYLKIDFESDYSKFCVLFRPLNMFVRITIVPIIFYYVVVLWI